MRPGRVAFHETTLDSDVGVFGLGGDCAGANHSGGRLDGRAEERVGPGFCALATPEVTCTNEAKNGRSSSSYRAEGSWAKVMEEVKPGTYVLIQFGHNDQPGKPG